MLTGLDITNYRGIRSGEISNLGAINLFVGPNGSGKSSILESIFLGGYGINRPRQSHNRTDLSPETLIPQRHNENGFPNESMFFRKDASKPISINYKFKGGMYTFQIRKGWQIGWGTGTKLVEGPSEVQFFQPMRLLDIRVLLNKAVEFEAWDELLKVRGDRELVKVMNEVFNQKIESFTYSVSDQALKVLFADRDYALNIDDFGAGLRLAFRLFISVLLSRQSAVLVEEFDGYQHVDTFPKLVKVISNLSAKTNCQLFLATHSLDTVRFFAEEAQRTSSGSRFRVYQTSLAPDGTLNTSCLDASEALNLLGGGFDLRKVS